MTGRAVAYILTCGPLVLIVAAWVKVYLAREWKWPNAFALVALCVVTANATFGAGTFLYFELRPSLHLPPWEDPEILGLGLLFLLAPVGMILGGVAAFMGAPNFRFRTTLFQHPRLLSTTIAPLPSRVMQRKAAQTSGG